MNNSKSIDKMISLKSKIINENVNSFENSFELFGFTTGDYYCKCQDCGCQFLGDKRSNQCLSCAIKIANNLSNKIKKLKDKIKDISNIIKCAESKIVTVDYIQLKNKLDELCEESTI